MICNVNCPIEFPILGRVRQPTSVRLGVGPNFEQNAIFVTQGGGLIRAIKNRHVLQLNNPYN